MMISYGKTRRFFSGVFLSLMLSALPYFAEASGGSSDSVSPLDMIQLSFVSKSGGRGAEYERHALEPKESIAISMPLGRAKAMDYSLECLGRRVQVRVMDVAPFAVLEFNIPDGLPEAATGNYNTPALAFAIQPKSDYPRVFTFEMKPFSPPVNSLIPTAGPVVLYNDALDVIIVSPLDNFLVGLTSPRGRELLAGIEGEVSDLPKGFTHRVLVYAGRGINAGMEEWGLALRKWHGKERMNPYKDKPLSYLGYWTDNGSYYYYNTEKGMNYEDTLVAVKRDADERGIPYGYFQLDSWWYKKSANLLWMTGGTLVWEAKPEVFPHGVAGLHDRIGLPFVAHNRWYVKASPHKAEYDFVDGRGWRSPSIPTEQRFWDMIMDNCVDWGIEVYEQDWLDTMYDGVPYLRSGTDHAENWISRMAGAAASRGLTMQFCMASPGFFLQNVKLEPVTHARCSGDYLAGAPKTYYWSKFFKVSMLAWAVGMYPFKDCYLSAEGQRTVRDEKYGVQETLISCLSAGPVGPGDKIGFADKELLLRTCRKDGLLLKPDRPAAPIDEMFLDTEKPFTVTTFSSHSGKKWHYIAAFNLHPSRYNDKSIALSRLGIQGDYIIWDWRGQKAFAGKERLNFPDEMKKNDYAYYVAAPILNNGMALIGEYEKFTTASSKRFERVASDGDSLRITVSGVPGETVALKIFSPQRPPRITINGKSKAESAYADSVASVEFVLEDSGIAELMAR